MTDLNTKKLETIGYLNKMTGHIWTPMEQPDAVDHLGIYEPLMRLSDAVALVAENARMREAIEFATAPDMWQEQHDGMLEYRYSEWYVDVLNAAIDPQTEQKAGNHD